MIFRLPQLSSKILFQRTQISPTSEQFMFFVRHYFLCKNIKRENLKEIFLSYLKALRYWSVLAGLELVTSRLAVRHYQFTGYRVYLAAVSFLVKKKV